MLCKMCSAGRGTMMKAVLLPVLIYNCVTDMRHRTINVWPNVLAGAYGVWIQVLQSSGELTDLLWGFVPGVLLLLVSYMTKDAVGKGDGLIFLMTGCWLDGSENFRMFSGTLILSGVFAGILLMTKKVRRKTELPMTPFILSSYLGMILL